jgi:hypothetical protein
MKKVFHAHWLQHAQAPEVFRSPLGKIGGGA